MKRILEGIMLAVVCLYVLYSCTLGVPMAIETYHKLEVYHMKVSSIEKPIGPPYSGIVTESNWAKTLGPQIKAAWDNERAKEMKREKILAKKLAKRMKRYLEIKAELESLGVVVREYRADFGTVVPREENTLGIVWPLVHNPVPVVQTETTTDA